MKIFFEILSVLLFGAELAAQSEVISDPRTGKPARYAGNFMEKPSVSLPRNPVFRKTDFRGVWVATVENIDFPKSGSAAEFKKNFLRVADNLKSINANAILFQVRPMNDAFYPSKLNPYSVYMTGTAGAGFGSFDPLAFMIEESHKRGLEFHAWLNPYRVAQNLKTSKKECLANLSAGNFARKHPELVLEVPGEGGKRLLILDPGSPAVRAFFLATVREILAKYPVDAIHLDDYFYPYGGTGNADAASYARHNSLRFSLDDWRRNNVDLMVSSVSSAVRESNRKTGRKVRFGISPFGIWANRTTMAAGSHTGGSESYVKQYADTRKWVKSGWLDYIAPQLYWTFGHTTAAYAHLTDWWVWTVKGTNTKLYIGQSPSRLGSNSEWSRDDEIYNQLRYNSLRSGVSGSILFSYSKLFSPLNPTMERGVRKTTDAWRSAK